MGIEVVLNEVKHLLVFWYKTFLLANRKVINHAKRPFALFRVTTFVGKFVPGEFTRKTPSPQPIKRNMKKLIFVYNADKGSKGTCLEAR